MMNNIIPYFIQKIKIIFFDFLINESRKYFVRTTFDMTNIVRTTFVITNIVRTTFVITYFALTMFALTFVLICFVLTYFVQQMLF